MGRSDLLEDRDGTVWVAASNGLYRLEKQDWQLRRFETPAFRENRNEDFRILLQDGTGAIWAGTDSGLVRIPSIIRHSNDQEKDERFVIARRQEGRVWVGSAGGDETQVGLHLFLTQATSRAKFVFS